MEQEIENKAMKLFNSILKLLKFRKEEKETVKRSSMRSLAPKILTEEEDVKKIQPYLDKLRDTLDARGINNIALTGGYGSGKSTIIETFKDRNKDFKYLSVSLASFNIVKRGEDGTKEEKKALKDELERLLEISILQQIFYHVKPSLIPESRFKRIIKIPRLKIALMSFCFIVWVISCILLLKYDYLDRLNINLWNFKSDFDWIGLVVLIISFSGLGFLSQYIVGLFSNSRINKISVKGELELGENVSKSVFNEHLEEILYFFECTEFNVVIIEDLDRFDNTDIFTKLREINVLLNNSIPISREIKFVYAVGDDLFEDKKERVKFFEYIIPVIPFIDSSNADEQLRGLIKDSGLKEDIFSKDFIYDITTFITDIDMRLLTNIFHEFVIYRNILNYDKIKGNDEELFSMITYKNTNPGDFSLLKSSEGELFKFINRKSDYIKKITDEIDPYIKAYRKKIEDIKGEQLMNIKELRKIYMYEILSRIDNRNVNLNEINIEMLIEDTEFKRFIENGVFKYSYRDSNNYYSQNGNLEFRFSEIEKAVNPNRTYKERLETVTNKEKNLKDEFSRMIAELSEKKYEVENWDIKDIFKEISISDYLIKEKFANYDLIRNLILEGYINENYTHYTSLFHEGSITLKDFLFEKNVKSQINTPFDYKLSDQVEYLLKKFGKKHYYREAILNFNLIDFLGMNYNHYSEEYNSVISLLSNEKEISIRFIDEYIKDETRPLKIFFEKLVAKWPKFWEYIVEDSKYDRSKIDVYLRLMVLYAKEEDILNKQSKMFLIEMIESNGKFLELVSKADKAKVKNIIKALNIRFNSLYRGEDNGDGMFDYICKNNYYRIDESNLFLVLKLFGRDDDVESKFKYSNYSTILNSGFEELIAYVKSNISFYLENVYLKLKNNQQEEGQNYIELLNNEDLNQRIKTALIDKIETKLEKLDLIEYTSLYPKLFENNRVKASWKNLLEGYKFLNKDQEESKLIPDSIITFINRIENTEELSKNKIPEEADPANEHDTFWRRLIEENKIDDDSYQLIVKSRLWSYSDLNLKSLSKNKVQYLLEGDCLTPTNETYELLRESHSGLNISLFEKEKEEYFKILDELCFDDHDLGLILKSEVLNNSEKLKVVDMIDIESIEENDDVLQSLSSLLLSDKELIVDEDILMAILLSLKVSVLSRIELFEWNTNLDDESFIDSFVECLGGEYQKIKESNKRAKISKNTHNHALLIALRSRGYISSFSETESFYRVNHKKK